MRIAFATCAAQAAGRPDDLLAGDLIGAELATWDDPEVDWAAYDRVVIRSVWDYTAHHDRFLAWSAAIGPEKLRNGPELVAFNSDKLYLRELKVPTVATTFLAPGEALAVPTTEIVVKPNVSAGGRDTGRFEPPAAGRWCGRARPLHRTGLRGGRSSAR